MPTPSFGHHLSPLPLILRDPLSPLISYQCPSFCGAPLSAPSFVTNAPHFATPPERPLIRTPMPLILRYPLSPLISANAPHFATPPERPSFLTNAPHFGMPLSAPFISHQCPSFVTALWVQFIVNDTLFFTNVPRPAMPPENPSLGSHFSTNAPHFGMPQLTAWVPLIRVSFLRNVPYFTTPLSALSFHQCLSFCDTPWVPLIPHQCPSFCDSIFFCYRYSPHMSRHLRLGQLRCHYF